MVKAADVKHQKTNTRGVALPLALSLLMTLLPIVGCSSKGAGKARGAGFDAPGYADGGAGAPGGELSELDLAANQEARYGDGSIPTAEGGGIFKDVFFDYDSSTLSAEAQLDVESNANLLRENPAIAIKLEGHCDDRGTEEYNLALGDLRAKSVKNALVALGVPNTQIETISYGENLPLDPAGSDYALALNRRVHFSGGARGANVGSGEPGRRY